MSYHLDWEHNFLISYGTLIRLPEGCVLWRGYETKQPAILPRPSYYGSYDTAKEYAKLPNRKLGAFKTTTTLRLFDIRFLKVILEQFFQENAEQQITGDDKHCILATTISFGLCSLSHQLKLMKYAYKGSTDTMERIKDIEKSIKITGIIESPGIRVGETYVDGTSVAFLKEILSGVADGFISPRLKSPYHSEKDGTINPELILFDPEKAGLQQISTIPSNLPVKNINEILRSSHIITTLYRDQMHSAFYMTGGGNNKLYYPPIEQFNALLTKKDKRAIKDYTVATQTGKKWKNKLNTILTFHPPNPTVHNSIFAASPDEIETFFQQFK
jgi:hypothetical protein